MKLYGDEKIFNLTLKDGSVVKALGFWGNESHFSNFHPCKIKFMYRNEMREIDSSEQMFMIFKSIMFKDDKSTFDIIDAQNPMLAKSIGRSVKNYDDKKWSESRYEYMVSSVMLKAVQNKDFRDRLTETKGMYLVEASPYDKIWGVGLKTNESDIRFEDKWRGENLLGKALMKVRDDLNLGKTIKI